VTRYVTSEVIQTPLTGCHTQPWFHFSFYYLSSQCPLSRGKNGHQIHKILTPFKVIIFERLSHERQRPTRQKISSLESKLNLITARMSKALLQQQLSSLSFTNSLLCPSVSTFYVLILASLCLTTLRPISSIGRVCPFVSLSLASLPHTP
jgi:hypothetical protein